jgi:hypothetical protein
MITVDLKEVEHTLQAFHSIPLKLRNVIVNRHDKSYIFQNVKSLRYVLKKAWCLLGLSLSQGDIYTYMSETYTRYKIISCFA